MYVEYSSNNSGGGWWLKDDDWKNLEAAGWRVVWSSLEHKYTKDRAYARDEGGVPILVPIGTGDAIARALREKDVKGEHRFLGALACSAYRVGLPMSEAIAEWERVTGQNADSAGCPCCGQPHNFTQYDATGRYVASGPVAMYESDDGGDEDEG